MGWETVTLVTSSGNVTSDRFLIAEDSIEKDLEPYRPPFSETVFLKGTGLERGRLALNYVPRLEDDIAALSLIDDLISKAPVASSVNWNGRTRNVYGLGGNFSISPTADSYNVNFALETRSDWTSGGGTIRNRDTGISITNGSSSLGFCSQFPNEEFSFQRRIEITRAGLLELGDLKYNPSRVTLQARIREANANDSWATMVQLVSIAKTISSLTVGSKTVSVLGLKRISRRYADATIFVDLTFLLASRLYPFANYQFIDWAGDNAQLAGSSQNAGQIVLF